MNCNKIIDFGENYKIIDKEIDHLYKEKNAFKQFTNRVEKIRVKDTTVSKEGGDVHIKATKKPDITNRIKYIYADTILQIPHYEEIYDESIPENMIHELGYSLYQAIEGASSFNTFLKASLISAGTDAVNRRKEFINTVKKEKDYITEFSHPLFSICNEISKLQNNNGRLNMNVRLEELLDRCENIAMQRQKQIRSRRNVASEFYNGDFEEYLYSDLSNQYPILSRVSEFMAEIKKYNDS